MKLIKNERGNLVAKNIRFFKDLDHKEISRKIIEQNPNHIIDYVNDFKELDESVALELIAQDEIYKVLHNLEKFNLHHREDIVSSLVIKVLQEKKIDYAIEIVKYYSLSKEKLNSPEIENIINEKITKALATNSYNQALEIDFYFPLSQETQEKIIERIMLIIKNTKYRDNIELGIAKQYISQDILSKLQKMVFTEIVESSPDYYHGYISELRSTFFNSDEEFEKCLFANKKGEFLAKNLETSFFANYKNKIVEQIGIERYIKSLPKIKETLSDNSPFTPSKDILEYENKYNFPEIMELIKPALINLIEQLKDSIESGEYETIISDEASARIPSLIVRKILKEKYPDNQKPPKIYFLNFGRAWPLDDELEKFIANNNQKWGKTLFMT